MQNKEIVEPLLFTKSYKSDQASGRFEEGCNCALPQIQKQSPDTLDYPDIAALIDFSSLSSIFENFYNAVGLHVSILDLEAKALASSSMHRLCVEFHRTKATSLHRCLESDIKLVKQVQKTKTLAIQQCFSGLIDSAAPIIVEGQLIACLFVGQFFFEQPDLAFYQKKQKQSGFNESEYFKALAEIPVIDQDKLSTLVKFLTDIILQIATKSLAEHWVSRVYDNVGGKIITEPANRQACMNLFQTVSSKVPCMIYQFRLRPDGTSCMPFASNRIEDIFQLQAEDVVHDVSKIVEMVHVDDRRAFLKSINHSAVTGSAWHHRFRICLPNGTQQWLLGKAVPSRESDGSYLWHGFVTELTDEMDSEEKLQLAASVFMSSQEGIVFIDANKKLVDVNPAFTKITGYSHEQAIGLSIESLASTELSAVELYEEIWRGLSQLGSWKGEVWWKRKSGEIFPARLIVDAVPQLPGKSKQYVALFSDISQVKEYEAELKRIAHYDILTGIPNRHLLGDRLLQAMARINRTDKFLAVCYFDLDGFKPVNDRFGHAAGDQLLITTTNRLQKVLRANDTLARIGGDEFVLLFSDLTKLQELEHILERTMSAINTPVIIGSTAVSVTASIGVTLYPSDHSNADGLLRHADQAMYYAKSIGKNCYHLFDPKTACSVNRQKSHQERLALAFNQDEFVLHYQPQVDLLTGKVFGVEALIRWQHPDQGLLMPAAFLSLLEGQELEVVIGEWVIKSALIQIKHWQELGIHLSVSVNISASHLLNESFPVRLGGILGGFPTIANSALELDIQEAATLTDLDFAARIIARCQALGVRFAQDDFGSGYASLTYYRNLPVDTLKIDQSFVQDMLEDKNDHGVVDSVVRLGRAFKRRVIAEGVESMEHGAKLKQLGCYLMQGFGIAQPMSAEQLPDWLAEWKAGAMWLNLVSVDEAYIDPTLNAATQNYRQWLSEVTDYLAAPKLDDAPDLDYQYQLFERWYYGTGAERYGSKRIFLSIAPLHELVHNLATELTQMAKAGRADGLKARLPEFNKAYEDLLAKLDLLIQSQQNQNARTPRHTN